MEGDRRKALEARREAMQARTAARELQSALEPAWTALHAAGEDFRVYALGEEPAWSPDWVPSGYSTVPWRELGSVSWSEDGLSRDALVRTVAALMAERAAPETRILLLPDGKRWSVELTCAAFVRHAAALLEAAWYCAYLAAPPAQWLIHADRQQVIWKDH